MMDVRLLKKKNGEIVLQKYAGAGQNRWGHVVFEWIDVETVNEQTPDDVSGATEKNDG